MIIEKCKLKDALILIPEAISDNRGYFARSFCQNELSQFGVEFHIKQCNYSFNEKRGTLRGMHYQKVPYLEDKIVTCISGSAYDVIIDFREDSESYLQWEGFHLSASDYRAIYIPKGFAHGFVTLENQTCMFYQMSEFYHKGYEAGFRYNDPKIGIAWPSIESLIISEKDSNFNLL